MRSQRFVFLVFCTAILMFCSLVMVAQPANPAGGDPDSVPITGIEILLGVGGLLGLKKIRDSRKKQD